LVLALAEQVAGIDAEPPIVVDTSGRPGDRDGVDPIDRAETEVEARVGGRLVAGRGVVGDEQVDSTIVVEVGGDHPQAAAITVDVTIGGLQTKSNRVSAIGGRNPG